ncbi:IS66 family insertion sequence element accessory protein TnpB [Providencia huaxiensis]|uniref:IS66 family insertion sequence element accessory protein TnpB n=2 Tax=Morganellaceae TaxID=1903414 RepID=UPI0018CC8C8A|nr:IS66 family insertion sequence element accessory protein TnpB [Proteus mirabilis]MBN4867355.1 IS66 family insertion sequence element accessory protein TnpB [Providencia stuartii]MBZ3683553.1 IS66 family insertion sequence element accessory protein TnpB [Providencia rettgeri]QPN91583.1 IS66 family insertion sequence element accessory protein TnpB [Proteus vulgaris]UAX03635.1 IS66 family insertion sequence element accessory protein TnpB [Proteus terrae subsp. cibarius]
MKRMLSAPEIYLYRESVDFRKSINGLAAIIENDTDLPLGSGALFLFTNKQCDKVKVLYWDKTGFALWYIIANIYKADLRTNSFVSIHINS